GDCGTSTSMSVADGVALERLGIPTATVCSSAFYCAARFQAAGRGLADLPVVEIPHPMHTAPEEMVSQRAAAALDQVVEALTRRVKPMQATERERLPERVVVDEGPDGLQEFFFEQGWSDGRPAGPPTEQAVRAMLATVARAPDELVGPIPPRLRMATMEKLAVNAVMAGCRPDYFPVVLAAVEAVLNDDCRLYGIQTATNTTTPILIVNGPSSPEPGMNARRKRVGQGCRPKGGDGRGRELQLR